VREAVAGVLVRPARPLHDPVQSDVVEHHDPTHALPPMSYGKFTFSSVPALGRQPPPKLFPSSLHLPVNVASRGSEETVIFKAVGGWVREAGKRDPNGLLDLLDRFAATMPRTALRYAVEHLDKSQRDHYMGLKKLS
jgi:DNA alkylation repair enzyme